MRTARIRLGVAAWAIAAATCATISGCGASMPAWSTWYSGACDARFEMPGTPISAREVTQQSVGEVAMTVHRADIGDTSYVYSCRAFPAAYFAQNGAGGMADQVIDHELQAFDSTWHAEPKRVVNVETRAVTLTHEGRSAELHVISVGASSETHGTLTIGVALEVAKRFVAGITLRPPAMSPAPVRVQSAECLSSIVMPGAPRGIFVQSVVTHVLEDKATQRTFTLRCALMDASTRLRTPAELFHQSLVDTEQDGQWKAREAKDFELDGRHAREQRYVSADGQRELLVRVAVDGDRLQIASFSAASQDARIGRAFLDSFRLVRPAR